MEFYRETRYTVPRVAVFTLLNAEAVAQVHGFKEIVDFQLEWIKAERIYEALAERFPQNQDEDYAITFSADRIFEGHNLFNVSGRAVRYVETGTSSADLLGRSKLLTAGIA